MPRRVAGGTAIITAATIIRSTTITATTITPGTTITTVAAIGIANPGYSPAAALEARARQMDELACQGRYPSGLRSGGVARLRRVRTARLRRRDRRAQTDCRRTRTHRR